MMQKPTPSPNTARPTGSAGCRVAIVSSFKELADRFVAAGWRESEVAIALLLTASEHLNGIAAEAAGTAYDGIAAHLEDVEETVVLASHAEFNRAVQEE